MGARKASRKPHFYRWLELLRSWAASNGSRIRAMAKPRSGSDPHPCRRNGTLRIVRLAEDRQQVGRAIARVMEETDRITLSRPAEELASRRNPQNALD